MATYVTGALGGVDPSIMGVGPVASTKKALAKADLTIDDMALIEANVAFAAQSVAVAIDLKFDMSKVNVNGGAIALGPVSYTHLERIYKHSTSYDDSIHGIRIIADRYHSGIWIR